MRAEDRSSESIKVLIILVLLFANIALAVLRRADPPRPPQRPPAQTALTNN